MNDKLKEVANHIRHLSKKNSSSNASTNFVFSDLQNTSLFSDLSTVILDEEDLPLDEQPNDAVAIDVISNNKTSQVEELDNIENLSLSNSSRLLSDLITPTRNPETINNESESSNNEQTTPNQYDTLSQPGQTSTPILIKQNRECTQETQNIVESTISSESKSSEANSSLCHQYEQQHNERLTIRTVQPYVSILTHFKTPRLVFCYLNKTRFSIQSFLIDKLY